MWSPKPHDGDRWARNRKWLPQWNWLFSSKIEAIVWWSLSAFIGLICFKEKSPQNDYIVWQQSFASLFNYNLHWSGLQKLLKVFAIISLCRTGQLHFPNGLKVNICKSLHSGMEIHNVLVEEFVVIDTWSAANRYQIPVKMDNQCNMLFYIS